MYNAVARILKNSREQVHGVVQDLTPEQWMTIPAGHDNNIAWNVGHLIWAQAGLCYGHTNLQMPIERDPYAKLYGIGTSPATWASNPDPAELMKVAMWQADKMLEDAAAGLFDTAEYEAWTLGSGLHLATLLDMHVYNATHEGEHRGMIMALRNLV